MSKIGEFLMELPDAELKEILKTLNACDDLSLQLIRKIAGPHSPLSVSQLPFGDFPRDATLVKLYDLQKLGIFTSKLTKKGNDRNYVRVFGPTPLAGRIRHLSSK